MAESEAKTFLVDENDETMESLNALKIRYRFFQADEPKMLAQYIRNSSLRVV